MKRNVHDRGGWPGDTLIGRSEHDPAYGEQQADAMMRLLAAPIGSHATCPARRLAGRHRRLPVAATRRARPSGPASLDAG
jgi:hypothetical protein